MEHMPTLYVWLMPKITYFLLVVTYFIPIGIWWIATISLLMYESLVKILRVSIMRVGWRLVWHAFRIAAGYILYEYPHKYKYIGDKLSDDIGYITRGWTMSNGCANIGLVGISKITPNVISFCVCELIQHVLMLS